jgi:hypothetical protein
MFAFSHKEFVKPNEHTSVFKSAVDAFNIFDLFVEVWKNVKWLFLAVILRRPYVRNPEDGKFDIYDAVNGKRDVAVYGDQETYAMLDVPGDRGRSQDNLGDEDGVPPSLFPAGKKHFEDEEEHVESKDLDVKLKPQEYVNTYGSEDKV